MKGINIKNRFLIKNAKLIGFERGVRTLVGLKLYEGDEAKIRELMKQLTAEERKVLEDTFKAASEIDK